MVKAGYFLLLSSALHLVGFALTGFNAGNLFLVFPAALYVAFFFGLSRDLIWVAWLAFICMLGGMAGTVFELYRTSLVPDWVLWGILGADFTVAVLLAAALWAGRGRRKI
ncbi:MAG: hypothetical protein ACFB6R_16310 [Alphaproteobacteria bacterium]